MLNFFAWKTVQGVRPRRLLEVWKKSCSRLGEEGSLIGDLLLLIHAFRLINNLLDDRIADRAALISNEFSQHDINGLDYNNIWL